MSHSKRCAWGIHDYRTEKVSSKRGPLMEQGLMYIKDESCKRCGLNREVIKFKPFRRIKT